MQYLGEIGHLEASADLMIAKAVYTQEGVRIGASDDRGHSWTAKVRVDSGIGWTDVWLGDFDGNGRKDLLIAATFPGNGRCVDPVHLTFLMMDSTGRPVPWSIDSHWPKAAGEGKRPALLVDFERDGRAKLIATECEYAPGPKGGEDRRIAGIYEAKDAHWRRMRPADPTPYSALFRANYGQPNVVHLLSSTEDASINLSNLPAAGETAPTLRETKMPPAECTSEPAVWIPPLVNGKLDRSARNACDDLRYPRLILSDGSTCYVQPGVTVVVDRGDGREIVETERLDDVGKVLQRLAEPGLKITPVGQRIDGKCSPIVLWTVDR